MRGEFLDRLGRCSRRLRLARHVRSLWGRLRSAVRWPRHGPLACPCRGEASPPGVSRAQGRLEHKERCHDYSHDHSHEVEAEPRALRTGRAPRHVGAICVHGVRGSCVHTRSAARWTDALLGAVRGDVHSVVQESPCSDSSLRTCAQFGPDFVEVGPNSVEMHQLGPNLGQSMTKRGSNLSNSASIGRIGAKLANIGLTLAERVQIGSKFGRILSKFGPIWPRFGRSRFELVRHWLKLGRRRVNFGRIRARLRRRRPRFGRARAKYCRPLPLGNAPHRALRCASGRIRNCATQSTHCVWPDVSAPAGL